jgi:hypothetical protein
MYIITVDTVCYLYVLQKSIRKYRFFGHANVTGIENLYIFHSSQEILPNHFAAV